MIFHENRLLTDDSHVMSYLIFVENWERYPKMFRLPSVVIGALRVDKIIRTIKPGVFPEKTKLISSIRVSSVSFFPCIHVR